MITKLLFDFGCLIFGVSGLAGMIRADVKGDRRLHARDVGAFFFGLAAVLDLITMTYWV